MEKLSQYDGWQESYDLPTGWRSKEKQSKFKGDRGISHMGSSSQDEVWQERRGLPTGTVVSPSPIDQIWTDFEEKKFRRKALFFG